MAMLTDERYGKEKGNKEQKWISLPLNAHSIFNFIAGIRMRLVCARLTQSKEVIYRCGKRQK